MIDAHLWRLVLSTEVHCNIEREALISCCWRSTESNPAVYLTGNGAAMGQLWLAKKKKMPNW
jgi:hypothetical protein